MKKQSGFTLIELLLVLAIIGIISAIAIPALLSQRARARDKAAIDNMTGSFGDMIGQYDKLREAGVTATSMPAQLGSYLKVNHAKDLDPWDAATLAFDNTVQTQTGVATASLFFTGMQSPTALGQVQYWIQTPTASNGIGFFGGAVRVQNVIDGSTTVRKVAAIE